MSAKAAVAAIALAATVALPARGDDLAAAERRRFFEAVTSAKLANGDKVNCCGWGDAVKVRMIGNAPGGFIVQIIHTMRSSNGKVGDVIIVPRGKITIEIASPFPEPVLFINSENAPYCISFGSGG